MMSEDAMDRAGRDAVVVALDDFRQLVNRVPLPPRASDLAWNAITRVQDARFMAVARWYGYLAECAQRQRIRRRR